LRLSIDAVDTMHRNPRIDTFVLVSGDGDFVSVVQQLKTNGKQVIGYSTNPWGTAGSLKTCCDEFCTIGVEEREEREERTPRPHVRPIFVGGVAHTTTEETLQRFCEQHFGPVTSTVLKLDHKGTPRGFGFVTFREDQAANAACERHYDELDGKRIEFKRHVKCDQDCRQLREAIDRRFAQMGTKRLNCGGLKVHLLNVCNTFNETNYGERTFNDLMRRAGYNVVIRDSTPYVEARS
jgi:hypothetical protein